MDKWKTTVLTRIKSTIPAPQEKKEANPAFSAASGTKQAEAGDNDSEGSEIWSMISSDIHKYYIHTLNTLSPDWLQ